MSKWLILGLAVLGVWYALPNLFPSIQHTAFTVGSFAITYLYLVLAGTVFFGWGLKAAK